MTTGDVLWAEASQSMPGADYRAGWSSVMGWNGRLDDLLDKLHAQGSVGRIQADWAALPEHIRHGAALALARRGLLNAQDCPGLLERAAQDYASTPLSSRGHLFAGVEALFGPAWARTVLANAAIPGRNIWVWNVHPYISDATDEQAVAIALKHTVDHSDAISARLKALGPDGEQLIQRALAATLGYTRHPWNDAMAIHALHMALGHVPQWAWPLAFNALKTSFPNIHQGAQSHVVHELRGWERVTAALATIPAEHLGPRLVPDIPKDPRWLYLRAAPTPEVLGAAMAQLKTWRATRKVDLYWAYEAQVIWGLAQAGAVGLPTFTEALAEPFPCRHILVRAVAGMKAPEAAPLLASCLEDKAAGPRETAARGLRELPTPIALQAVAPLLDSRRKDTRLAAIDALGGKHARNPAVSAALQERQRVERVADIKKKLAEVLKKTGGDA